jgi:hypothetical protein
MARDLGPPGRATLKGALIGQTDPDFENKTKVDSSY